MSHRPFLQSFSPVPFARLPKGATGMCAARLLLAVLMIPGFALAKGPEMFQYWSVADTEELARPCIQAGFQCDDTGVEFCLLCAQALLFRFRCSDVRTQFP